MIGPSGAGKTTLLRLFNRLDEPFAGSISLGDLSIGALPVIELRRLVGLVFQSPRPLPGSVRDNLVYPCELARIPIPNDLPARLQEIGLEAGWLDRDATALSGGERQRLAIAVALMNDPIILALDEPTSALDPQAAWRVAEALKTRSIRDGLTTIAVTHNREQAAWLSDQTLVMDAGQIADVGPTTDVVRRIQNASVWQAEAGAIS